MQQLIGSTLRKLEPIEHANPGALLNSNYLEGNQLKEVDVDSLDLYLSILLIIFQCFQNLNYWALLRSWLEWALPRLGLRAPILQKRDEHRI